ncbi:MAG: hypothetical protein ACLFN5_04750 [bacterium]
MDFEKLSEQLEEIAKNPFALAFEPQEVIMEALYHSDDELRKQAINLAASFDAADFIEPLFHLIADDNRLEIRLAGLHCLGDYLHRGLMADYHLAGQKQYKTVEDEEIKGLTLLHFNLIRDYIEKIVEQEDWPNALRGRALVYYALAAPELAAASINRFYNSGEAELVTGAVKAIARIKQGEWRQIIMRELMREVNDARRLAALEAAAVHDIYEAGPELIRILDEETDKQQALAAVETLGYLSWPKATDYLKKYAESDDPQIAETAQTALLRHCEH